jgi:hypothetical protein
MPKKPQRRPIRSRRSSVRSTAKRDSETSKSVGGLFLKFPWKRSWGRPSAVLIVGSLVFDLSLLFGWFAIGIVGATQFVQSLPQDLGNTALMLVVAVVWAITGGWFLRSLLRLWKYQASFDWSSDRQAELDATLKDDDFDSHEPAAAWTDRYRVIVDECIKGLSRTYAVKALVEAECERVSKQLNSFSHSGNPQSVRLLDAFRVSADRWSCTWLTFDYEYTYRVRGASRTGSAIRQAVLVEFPCAAESVLIRPETLSDQITQLLGGDDTDFPHHAEFSRSYYVIATHPSKLQETLPRAFMDAFCEHSQLVARIENGWLLIAHDGKLAEASATRLVKTARAATTGEMRGRASS